MIHTFAATFFTDIFQKTKRIVIPSFLSSFLSSLICLSGLISVSDVCVCVLFVYVSNDLLPKHRYTYSFVTLAAKFATEAAVNIAAPRIVGTVKYAGMASTI